MNNQQVSMHKDRMDLNIIFRRTLPEMVLDSLRKNRNGITGTAGKLDAYTYPEDMYRYFSTLDMSEYSAEEVDNRHYAIWQSEKISTIFDLLPLCADKMLILRNQEPVCQLNRILSWNACAEMLGQDIFTTAWLAKNDGERYVKNERRRDFTWPAVLTTDDVKLQSLFKQGLAENHYHLHGSTQSFALSWACLMNHPDVICKYLKDNFSENLNLNLQKSSVYQVETWDIRIKYAALIRVLLFSRCLESVTGVLKNEILDEFKEFDINRRTSQISRHTEKMRYMTGEKFKQLSGNYKCLDYAITNYSYEVNQESDMRLPAGERNFLYQCFWKIYHGEFSYTETNLFYVYLLIKSNFRSEIVQNNGLVGFANFLKYQDRKNQFFESFDEYWTEGQRLSVAMAVKRGNISSLEARIMPKPSSERMNLEILDLDRRAELAMPGVKDYFYYIIHFLKIPFHKSEYEKRIWVCPRNVESRERAEKSAKALAKYLLNYSGREQRIYGIDACSTEIGCRPEVFATEFRFLRECSRQQAGGQSKVTGSNQKQQEWGITYHVGEDFLDIVDGLRAIDEAITFLEMRRGDRLGHAIALGIDVQGYYESKHYEIYLSKQDYLDNLVWMLFRTLELGVSIEADHRAYMEKKARSLLAEVYFNGDYLKGSLDLYYRSWMLRGDHPRLYISGTYKPSDSGTFNTNLYKKKMIRDGADLGIYREIDEINLMYYLYHFDKNVKSRGLMVENIQVGESDIRLVERIQRAMQLRVAKESIAIECNPTSNLRISMMKSYDQHPILRFNDEYIGNDCDNPHLWVSINTDDIGVFDTSLENEYAVMLDSICRMRHSNGEYDDYKVYLYLEYLRKNGIEMAFKK